MSNQVQDLFELYELSLSIGNTVHLRSNLEEFAQALISIKKLTYVGIWLKIDNKYHLNYSFPEVLSLHEEIEQVKVDTLYDNDSMLHFTGNHIYAKGIKDSHEFYGLSAKLGEIGFINICRKKELGDFEAKEINQLKNIFLKFSQSVKGCLFFQELNTEIDKRTHAEKELLKAKMHAEEASDLKTQFLSNMSHEIRTPLNAIIGLSSIMGSNELTPDDRNSYLQNISTAADHLLCMVNDILDFTKIDKGDSPYNESNFFAHDLMTDILEICEPLSTKNSVNLTHDIEKMNDQITSDPEKIHKIVLNLLNNAIKFSQGGNVHLTSEVLEQEEQSYLYIQVKDDGIGFDTKLSEMIFTPFTQVDNSQTRDFEGTGLGLSIVKQCLTLVNGEIEVESAPGRGTWFAINIPIKYQTSHEPTNELKAFFNTTEESDSELSVDTPNILIVEDNKMNQLVTCEYLKAMGFNYLVASHGKEALEKVNSHSFDLILMDCQMPIMDGYTATQEIRLKENYLKTPIIALTAHALSEDKEKCLNSGMSDYMTKPVQKESLEKRIEYWLNKSQKLKAS